MAKCEYRATGATTSTGIEYACPACGHRRTSHYPAAQLHRRCDISPPPVFTAEPAPCRRWLLGDAVHRIAKFFGFRACGRCRRRRRWLNRFSRWLYDLAGRLFRWLK